MQNFGHSNATPPATVPNRSDYGGIQCADSRDPLLEIGSYRVTILACSTGYNPGKRRKSFKASFRVDACSEGSGSPKGAVCSAIFMHSPAGLADAKRLAMAAAGFGPTLVQRANGEGRELTIDGERAYDALDLKYGYLGAVLDSSTGISNGAPSIVGRQAEVLVSRGKDLINPQTGDPSGDFFRNYSWGVAK